MTILLLGRENTAIFGPVDWIKELAKFDPPDRDLSVGGTEGGQPGLYPGSANFLWRDSQFEILSPSFERGGNDGGSQSR
jgi:hypothetical protein